MGSGLFRPRPHARLPGLGDGTVAEADRSPGIRPQPTLWRRLDALARSAFPVASTVILMILSHAPVGGSVLLPAVAVASVFFWSLFRPAAMPPPAVFMIGLLLDLLGWLPVGVGILVLLLVHGFCVRWRLTLTRQGFLLIWFVFLAFAVAAAGLMWAATALLTFQWLPLKTAMFQAIFTAALYPALAIPLARAHHTVADPEQA
jgi:rod shape-determining protein MreD